VTLDTASDPDDTTLLAAPDPAAAIYIEWLDIIVTTDEVATEIRIEDGVDGDVLAMTPSTVVGTFHVVEKQVGSDGIKLTDATLLNATSIGGTTVAARAVGECRVRGIQST
jgi:hypothetical protein